MAKISETELQRRLKALERKTSTKESNYLSSIDPIDGSFTEGDTHYNATTDNLWLFSSGTWSIDASVLHVRYADSVTTNPPTAQSQVINFSTDPLNPSGSLKAYRGLWWGGLTATTDPTDYEWFNITSTPSALTRYRSEDTGLRADMGTPSNPVEGVTWVLGGATTNTTWLADRFTIDGKVGPWELYPVKPMEQGVPLIRYVKAGYNAPTLNDSVWIADVILAAQSFTGRSYSNQMELGYGTVCVIKYDDAVLSGKFTQVSGANTWVSAGELIDGSLVVSGTVSADKIQANSITATQISAGAITAATIAAGAVTADKITIADNIAFTGSTAGLIFGKTSLADTTAGSFYGKSLDASGNAISGFNISSGSSGIYADSSGIMALNNVRIYTGSAGTALELPNPGFYATSIAPATTVISVIIIGGGAGAQNTMVPNINNTGLRVGSSGTSSWIEFYSGPVVSGSVTGNLLNISGTSRFEAAGGVRASFAFGSAGVAGPNGAASSQSNSAGAGGPVQNSQSALPDAGNGSRGGGGGGGGGNSYFNQVGMRAAGSVAPAGATISQQFTIPTGTQSVKSFVGTGGAGAAGGIIPYIFLQGGQQNVVTGYASSVGGGNGGNGFISIADPNSGGIEVDLVSLANRITALETYHP
jgi:hypothetical protein